MGNNCKECGKPLDSEDDEDICIECCPVPEQDKTEPLDFED